MAMRRTIPARGATLAAFLLFAAVGLAAAGDAKRKRAPEPAPPKVEETVGSIAVVMSGEIKVEGVGLVVGLDDTGSDPPPSPQRTRLLNDMRKASVEHPEKWLARPSCAMVLVHAVIPHGISTRDPIDVEVENPPASGTTSLAGGRLLNVELAPVMSTAQGPKEGKVLAVAGGPIMIGDKADPSKKTVGRVLGGGRVKKDVPYNLVVKDDRRSARTVKLVEDVIKERFHQSDGIDQKGMATATMSDNQLILRVPKVYHHNQFRYFQVIQNMALVRNPDLTARRMQAWRQELLDPKTAGKAALKLEGLGPNALPTLKEGLASADPQVKFFAAEAMAYLGSVDGVDVLAETAAKRPDFRSYALKALAAMDQSAGVMRLQALMGQAEVEVRYGAFDALRSFDETDAFLGQVKIFEDEPAGDPNDALAFQISTEPRRRRRPPREEPFKLYVVDCEGPPLVHISRNLRTEVVIFGKGQKLLPPVVLGAGGAVLLNAAEGDTEVQISRITHDSLDEPDSRVSSPMEIEKVIQNAARVGASYPDVVAILTGAAAQKNLPGPLMVDAMPMPSQSYTQAQLLGTTGKKDDAVKKAGAEGEKRPALRDRLRGIFRR